VLFGGVGSGGGGKISKFGGEVRSEHFLKRSALMGSREARRG